MSSSKYNFHPFLPRLADFPLRRLVFRPLSFTKTSGTVGANRIQPRITPTRRNCSVGRISYRVVVCFQGRVEAKVERLKKGLGSDGLKTLVAMNKLANSYSWLVHLLNAPPPRGQLGLVRTNFDNYLGLVDVLKRKKDGRVSLLTTNQDLASMGKKLIGATVNGGVKFVTPSEFSK